MDEDPEVGALPRSRRPCRPTSGHGPAAARDLRGGCRRRRDRHRTGGDASALPTTVAEQALRGSRRSEPSPRSPTSAEIGAGAEPDEREVPARHVRRRAARLQRDRGADPHRDLGSGNPSLTKRSGRCQSNPTSSRSPRSPRSPAATDGPVVMLNLNRYRERAEYEGEVPGGTSSDVSGHEAYMRYGEVARAVLSGWAAGSSGTSRRRGP